ncbi:hypothetical protein MVEN_01834300 [Mycena venus]|uniref:Uncharacterized protein n=1 Tax=Mycena venus TaxID=2733690 RepID=A0A8H6XL26_9AGAR|nr:hypothetical protein MVEN_01834300 [Mycena venus]
MNIATGRYFIRETLSDGLDTQESHHLCHKRGRHNLSRRGVQIRFASQLANTVSHTTSSPSYTGSLPTTNSSSSSETGTPVISTVRQDVKFPTAAIAGIVVAVILVVVAEIILIPCARSSAKPTQTAPFSPSGGIFPNISSSALASGSPTATGLRQSRGLCSKKSLVCRTLGLS